jgi:hypothetical protein
MNNLFEVSLVIWFKVSYSEKEKAKELRCRWCPTKKQWFKTLEYGNLQEMHDTGFAGFPKCYYDLKFDCVTSTWKFDKQEMHILTKQYLSKQKEYLDLKRIEDTKTQEQKEAEEDIIHEAHKQKLLNYDKRQEAIKLKQKEEDLKKEKLIQPKPDIKIKKKRQELYTHHGSRSLLISADMFDSDSD